MTERRWTDRELQARADLSHFSPERPLFVSKTMMAAMKREPCLADMMDRVRETRPLPTVGRGYV